ncbi:MAG: tetratricopeptide repeat protein [Bacteroidia bacterium]|nr:tetratricopeptide repeat protein [Bacteroidia bacterium]
MIKYIFIICIPVMVAGLFSCNHSAEKKAPVKDSLTIEKLTAQIRTNPKNAELFFQRSKLYHSKKQITDAVNDAEIAVKLDSLKPDYYLAISDYYLEQGKSGSSKSSLEKCIRLIPGTIAAYVKLADIYFYVKDYQKSMDYLLKAQQINKANPEVYFTKALIYKEMGDTARAIDNLRTSIENKSDYYDAYIELGHLCLLKNDSLAVAYLENAINILSGSTEARYYIGLYYQQNGKYDKAFSYFNTIITTVDKTYPYAYYNLGYISMEVRHDYNAAIDYFTRAIENKTNYYQAVYNRGLAYEMLKDYDQAAINYKQALNLLPNYNLAVAGLNRLDKKRKQ